MTTLILQTAALLLCAYFLGAWVACLVRRSFFGEADDVASLQPAGAVSRATVAPIDTGLHVSPPTRRPDPRPIALETIERAAPHAASDAASRFEEVLTTAPKQVVTAQPVARPAPAPAPAPVAAPVQAAPAVAATIAATPVKPVAPASPPPAVAATTTVNAGAIAQAAAAAAALAPSIAVAASKPAVPVSPPVHQNLPAASSGAGPSAVSAPLAPPIAPAAAPIVVAEDFTRIRAIDQSLQQRLVKLGVTRYRDIAGWLPADVERVSRELGFTGRIEQENWIEQAQILARGGETAYARRKAGGEVAAAAPSPNQGVAKPMATPAAPPAPVVPASPPQVESRAAFSQQPKPIAAAPTPPVAPVAPIAPVAPAPVVAKPVAPAAIVPPPVAPAPVAPPRAAAPAPSPSTVGMAAATAAAAAAGVGVASGMGRDNLQRIGGINAEVERLLNVQGVSRFSQIAGWSPVDMSRIDRLLGHEGRVAREGWVEQAATLSRGGDTSYSRQFDQRTAVAKSAAAPLDTPRPSRLADAIRDTAVKPAVESGTTAATAVASTAAAAGTAAAATDAASGPRASNLSGMRSVRSEAYAPQIGAKSSGHDDLKRVRGVGVLIEKKLNSMGVTTYAQVANWSGADIDRVSQVLDFKGRIERENWVEQARILSAGGQTEFSRRVDRGEVETSRS